ncbi:MAG: hypothetical protein ACLSAF_16945 [Intestinimonas sp.]
MMRSVRSSRSHRQKKTRSPRLEASITPRFKMLDDAVDEECVTLTRDITDMMATSDIASRRGQTLTLDMSGSASQWFPDLSASHRHEGTLYRDRKRHH